jgi:hypothetical protein
MRAFFSFLLFHPSWVQIFFTALCSQTPFVCVLFLTFTLYKMEKTFILYRTEMLKSLKLL